MAPCRVGLCWAAQPGTTWCHVARGCVAWYGWWDVVGLAQCCAVGLLGFVTVPYDSV